MLDRILIGSSAEPTDTNFKNVTLLLHGDGSNGAQNNTFIDSSTNNFTITRNGNTTQGSFSPYGSNWSNYFDGNGDFLQLPSSSAFAISTSTTPFTIEGWVFPTAAGGCIFSEQFTGSGSIAIVISMSNGTDIEPNGKYITFGYYTGSNWVYAAISNTELTLNTWTHVACVFTGSTTKIFFNGVDVTKTSSPTPATSWTVTGVNGDAWYVGRRWDTTQNVYFTGYISNFRFVNGTAVYTSAFTPSTTPLTAITNTSLLTCADNRFRDGSTNNFTITRNGDVKVTNFAPFAPSAAYSTTTNGGSAYLNGTSSYLTAPSNSAFTFGTGDFCLELWVFHETSGSSEQYFDQDTAGVSASKDTANKLVLAKAGTAVLMTSSGTVPIGQWAHLAITRSGSSVRMFINGVLDSTATLSTDFSATSILAVGRNALSAVTYMRGYISNLRVVKGSAVYTAAFTPPTSPVTAITNTSLLLNATNAAIFDNSMKNDLETVGNAQISTSVKKFGTGSMYFDGSGDYLVSNASSDLYAFGTGDFTIEMWFNLSSFSSLQILYDSRPTSTDGLYPLIYVASGGGSVVWQISATAQITGTTTLSTGVWYHLAVSRSSGSTKMFLNGTQIGSTYSDTNAYLNSGTNRPFIGGSSYSAGTLTVNGYIDDVRVTKGIARYTANFTAPTAPFPNK